MDGKNKRINFDVCYLGATKQIPYLVRAIREQMPYAKMNVCYSDYTGEEQEGILESDLKWEGIENEVNILTSSNWRRNKNSMEVEFGVSNSQYSME